MTEKENIPEKSSHFLKGGSTYARYRPTYPPEAAAHLASLCPAREMAVDVGCGSGQFSTLLAEHFNRVLATDISEGQLAYAAPHPRVTYACTPAEKTGVADHSADIVVVAQAVHWFDLPAFYEEAHRILRPDGVIALLSYGTGKIDDDDLNQRFMRYYDDDIGPYWPPERRLVESGYKTLDFPFDEVDSPDMEIVKEWGLEEVLGYSDSWSATRRALEDNKNDLIMSYKDDMRRQWGAPETLRKVTWQLHIRAGRV